MCVFACAYVCVCGVLYEAVILSILAALKQSDNPGVVNPRTAAAAVSTHTDSTQEHTLSYSDRNSTLIHRVGRYFIKQNSF